MSDLTQIGGNEFLVSRLDPEVPMELKVRTWSSVFSDGGSVSVDMFKEDGTRSNTTLASITVKDNAEARDAREELQGLLDDFQEDLEENWREMVLSARTKVLGFYRRTIAEYTEKLAKAERGEWG